LIGVAIRAGRGAALAEISNAFFAHEEPGDACEVCEARRYGEFARFATLTDTPPALVGDLWEACVAAGLVADVTSPRFEEQFYLAPQPHRNAPADPDVF
jgi:hypothetical protein